MNVGCVSYINALPLHLPFQLGLIHTSSKFTYGIPSVLNQMLREKKIDVALSSSVEYLDGNYRLLPHLGIVGLNQVLSVNLYTRISVDRLHGARIGLTHHSATSVSLLKVLCRHFWKISPKWEDNVPTLQQHRSLRSRVFQPLACFDAFLLIGNDALEHSWVPGFQTIDLAAAWYDLTGLPFVFALFSARKDIDNSELYQLEQELESALTWSEENPQEIERAAMEQCTLNSERIRAYYASLRYRLGKKEFESLELFRRYRLDV